MTQQNGEVREPEEATVAAEIPEKEPVEVDSTESSEEKGESQPKERDDDSQGERRNRPGRGRRGRDRGERNAAPGSTDENGDANGNVAGTDSGGESGADQPVWQKFGVPTSYWEKTSYGGQTRGRAGQGPGSRTGRGGPKTGRGRAARVLECRTCGIKLEKRRAHGRGRVACPSCGKWMYEK